MGAHVARPARPTTSTLILALVFVLLWLMVVSFAAPPSQPSPAVDALLKFKSSLRNNMPLTSWDASVEPCNWNQGNWIGVLCHNNTIWGLQLENFGLTGTIDIDALVSIDTIRSLSFMNNKFDGSLPEFRRLGKLKALYLSNNRFGGEIPETIFQDMGSLKRLYLANNEFTGNIPTSLTALSKLTVLKLEGNQFTGQIPDFKQKDLKTLNLASNELEGPIPASLSNLNPNSFSEPVWTASKSMSNPPSPTDVKKSKSHAWKIVLIVVIIVVVLAALALALFLFHKKKKHEAALTPSTSVAAATFNAEQVQHQAPPRPQHSSSRTRRADHAKLSFLRDDIEKFDLQDMLRASAEVLGSGTFGASYKAVVLRGQAVVVKRYRHMNNVGREEFHEHMRRLGRLSHPNLLPLMAYYYRKEEKLLVSEFVEHGSLASHIHGNHSLEEQGLDWQTRLKIIKGVAKGMAYLYNELPIMVPHGHLKSSNVLLDNSMEPLLTDYALRPVINPEHAHSLMIAYKSPEYTLRGQTTIKTDIWSFGILILEILTGKFPENYLLQGYDRNANLAAWVNKMVKEKRTGEVFDKEMTGTKNSKSEMINLLKIGLSCCEEDADRRLDIKEVVEKIEELKEGNPEEDYYGSEANTFSVRGNDEDFSFALDR
ncbi:hypothetical protein K2173_021766 [Erythroxylum novogranatense]|uniref:non-specific serine/threonine protein kinase n=1 Tax=Erythroxylum novogranatense TaxID=1862640 RepID=A0AAV8TWG0_9ROSI|nr:hypothetical protein K2173_021766 [Erythroxylum novogranatense]